MFDKAALLALSVEERLRTISKLSKADMLELADDDAFVLQVTKEIADNKEFVKSIAALEQSDR